MSSSSKLRDLIGVLRVVGDAGQAALPGDASSRGPCPSRALQAGVQVRVDVGHVRVVELLDPAEADHPRGHPVGEHDDVAADRLAVAELVPHLAEELVVVVDVGVVVDLDAGLLLELLQRRVVLLAVDVDVVGPVGEDQLLLDVAERSLLVQAPRSAWRPRCRRRPAVRRARARRRARRAQAPRREKPGAWPATDLAAPAAGRLSTASPVPASRALAMTTSSSRPPCAIGSCQRTRSRQGIPSG